MKIKQHYGWGLFLIMALAPFVLSLYYVNILTEIFIFAVFAIGLNILVGQTGLVSLGHAAFFGAGAYATGIAATNLSPNIFLIILIGVLISGVLALVMGFFAIKANGFYFLMLTLAFAQIVYSIVYQWKDVTGGSNGLSGIPTPVLFRNFELSNPVLIYYFILVVFAIILFIVNRLLHSPLGYVFIGIRENEQRMKSNGYNTAFYKNLSFLIAGVLGGLAGSLYVIFNSFISPSDVYWTMSGSVLLMVLIGGAGTLWGPIVGAAFIVLMETIIGAYTENWMMIIGVIFILFTIFAPKGIVGIIRTAELKFFKKKTRAILQPIKQQTKIDG